MTKKPYNRSLEAMREYQEEQRQIKKFNKSKEGQELHEKVRAAHSKEQMNPEDLPF